ncbi:malectin domain-containing carbohydrate-binding protein [Pedosphaera parvula]|uniref:APHP domain protein n=1 Tax=Pedosphaera parvula (strain Ellin514) TaxID=320771 RepID=B9XNP0_PEDPL|nr:malectin domain-containing carbohydrate-binding protein [Pedosphaera parvula]EEF58580.1 APHP domain protein [Pedosphaera parvula Ellin514]
MAALVNLVAQGISSSKLSAHLINAYTAGSSNIIAGHPRVLKILDVGSGMVNAMRAYKSGTPGGKVVLRVYSPRMYTLDSDPDASAAATNFWTTILQPSINSLSSSDRALLDYIEGPNEGQTPTLGYPPDRPVQASQWFNQFWTNLTPMIVAAGFKPCIGSIGVGNPGGSPAEMQSYLAAFVPALRQAKAAGGAWSYHAYTIQYTTDPNAEIYYSLRYRQFYNYFASTFPDLNNMPLILTEGGVDLSGDPNTSGWQARGPADWYQRWLNWFDSQMNQDSYVMGCTLFQNGNPSGWSSFDLEPIASWMRTYLTGPSTLPPAPTGVSAAWGLNTITLTWPTIPSTPTSFYVKRATVSGGPYSVIASNITTGVTNFYYLDTTATNGGSYFYVISALNSVGEGPNSPEITPQIFVPNAINCGGSAVGSYQADAYFSGGLTYAVGNTIDTNGLSNPAPMSVYQSQRYQNLTYTLPFFTPNAPYKLRLHFAEIYWTATGQRVFNVLVNGAQVLSSFDIIAAAGAPMKGNIQEINAISDSSGNINLQLVTITDQASINGIEVVANPTNFIPIAPAGLTTSVSTGQVSLSWSAPASATRFNIKRSTTSGGPYTTIASNVVVSAFTDYSFTPNTTYYYVVSGQNTLGEGPNSAQASATPTAGLPDVVITALSWTPNPALGGNNVTFKATVKNQGSAATPAGVVLGVGFNVDDAGATFSGSFSSALAPGSSVVLTANGGGSPSGTWPATPGIHTLTGNVDDINRFPESNENNNIFSTNMAVFVSGYSINSGGTTTGSFATDQNSTGGTTSTSTNTIDLSLASNVAGPQSLYQSQRLGDFTYSFNNLIPNQTYAVRLHFAELVYTNIGQRAFNVSINGIQKLTNFDIVAQSGGINRALIERFNAPADTNGQIIVQFTSVVDQALVNGIQILATNGLVNATPTLIAISNYTINANQLLSFTTKAIDPDQPTQNLTYSIVTGAPGGATIGPISGLFTWTPTLLQAPGTNTIQVRATDNASPAASALKSFTVIVVAPPHISQLLNLGTNLSLSFDSYPGKTYRLQYKDDLSDTNWVTLGADTMASTSGSSFSSLANTNSQRFYRVLQLN